MPGPSGGAKARLPAGGQPVLLGVEARLYGAAAQGNVLLGERKGFPCGDGQLEVDEIEARHELRHGVLDLQAGVHLEKIELLSIQQKLDSPSVAVVRLPGQAHGGGAISSRSSGVRAGEGPLRPPSGGGVGSSTRARRGV